MISPQNCSFWLPVTPVSKESCLKFVGGSHKWGKWFVPKKFASLKKYNYTDMGTDQAFEEAPDIGAEPNKYKLFSWDLQVFITSNK